MHIITLLYLRSGQLRNLGLRVTKWVVEHDGKSGFYPLQAGSDALAARLRMMEKAEVSIDAQYFLMKADLDVIGVGPVAADVSDTFDTFCTIHNGKNRLSLITTRRTQYVKR